MRNEALFLREYCRYVFRKYWIIAKKHSPLDVSSWTHDRYGRRYRPIHIINKVRGFVNKRPRLRRRYAKLFKMDLSPIIAFHKQDLKIKSGQATDQEETG